MTFQIILVFAILVVAVVLLVTEWMPMEVVALLVLGHEFAQEVEPVAGDMQTANI